MRLAKLGDISDITMGQAPAGDTYNEENKGFPLIAGASDFGMLTPEPTRHTSAPSKLSKIGEIIMCIRATIGDLNWSNKIYCLGRGVAGINPHAGVADVNYIWRVLEAKAEHLRSLGRGATFLQISRKDIETLEIPLPPLQEQKRIAAILDKADELRRLRQESIKKLNTLSQSIFYEMFGDPDVNPYGFSKGVIGDLLEETQYGTSSKAGALGSFPILRMGNISIDGKIEVESLKYIDLEDKEIEKFTVKDGDILFNRTNSPDLVGKTAVYYGDDTYAFAGYLVRARVNKLAVPEYISMYLNSSHGKKVLRNMCKAIVGMANINAQELKKIRILKPPVELQIEFQKKLIAIQKYFPEQSSSSIEMETLFQSLQHRAFYGEL